MRYRWGDGTEFVGIDEQFAEWMEQAEKRKAEALRLDVQRKEQRAKALWEKQQAKAQPKPRAIRIKRPAACVPRTVAEKMISRRIMRYELVHHIDGNPQNNDPGNLLVITRAMHNLLHASLPTPPGPLGF